MRDFFIKLSRMDRRLVFIGVAICTVVPLVYPMGLPVNATRFTKMVFNEIEAAKPADDPESKPILLSMDFDPGTLAELGPMSKAVLRHIFAKKAKVIVISFMPTGAGLAQETVLSIAKEFPDVKEGVNWAYLGFNTPYSVIMQSIGRNIRDSYPTDYKKVPLDEMPIFRGVRNYEDIQVVVDLAGNNMPEYWISNAVERFGARVTMGVTNVMAADFTPYVHSGQSQGMLTGLRGAAEYERLIIDHGYWPEKGDAMVGMDPQSITHLFIILLIILGNLGFFLGRKKREVA